LIVSLLRDRSSSNQQRRDDPSLHGWGLYAKIASIAGLMALAYARPFSG
jgi:hypothetical protein